MRYHDLRTLDPCPYLLRYHDGEGGAYDIRLTHGSAERLADPCDDTVWFAYLDGEEGDWCMYLAAEVQTHRGPALLVALRG